MMLSVINRKSQKLLVSLLLLAAAAVLVACHEEDDIDFRAPSITIDSPTPGSNVVSTSVTITGTVSNDVVLVELRLEDDNGNIIGSPVQATLAGTTFSGALTLTAGNNKVVAMAQDAIGNSNTLSFILHYAQMIFSDTAADVVLGQEDFTSNTANRGSTPFAYTLSGVQGTPYEKQLTTLYIPDTGNNRILGFNSVPIAPETLPVPTTDNDANFVIGQADTQSNNAGTSTTELTGPKGVYTTTTQLFVADSGNNRVLIWDSHPTNNATAAAHVIGQTDFISSTPGCSSSTLSDPASVFVVDDKVVVLDKANHRVLIWNTIPDADGVAADIVVGQVGASAMDTCMPNDSQGLGVTDTLTASTLNNPSGLWTDGEKLLVADTDNHRVLVWDSFPTSNGQPADWVIGQANMTAATPELNQNSLDSPLSVYSNRVQIFIADTGNARVLIFNSFPAADEVNADSVVGQNDFVSNTTGSSDTLMTYYDAVYVDRVRLFVVDGNRVLIFNADDY